jgi:hypothetical protein
MPHHSFQLQPLEIRTIYDHLALGNKTNPCRGHDQAENAQWTENQQEVVSKGIMALDPVHLTKMVRDYNILPQRELTRYRCSWITSTNKGSGKIQICTYKCL